MRNKANCRYRRRLPRGSRVRRRAGMQNKANSGGPGRQRLLIAGLGLAIRGGAVIRCCAWDGREGNAPNKANFRVFGPDNEGGSENRSQLGAASPCGKSAGKRRAGWTVSLGLPAAGLRFLGLKARSRPADTQQGGAWNFGCQQNVRVIYMDTFGDTRFLARRRPVMDSSYGAPRGGEPSLESHSESDLEAAMKVWCGRKIDDHQGASGPATPTISLDLLSALWVERR